jgi:hypothetical protein
MNRGTIRITRRALAGLVAAAALAVPAQASAAGAGIAGGVLGIASGHDATDITVTRLAGNLVVDNGSQRLDAGYGCTAAGPDKVTCPTGGVAGIVASLGDGDDHFDSSAVALPVGANGGKGNDRIATGAASDNIDGSSGGDVLSTRDGAVDTVTCGTGSDSGQVDFEDHLSADCEAQVQRSAATPGSVIDTTQPAGQPVVPAPPDAGDAADEPAGAGGSSTAAEPGSADDPASDSGDAADAATGDAPVTITAPSAITLSPSGEMTVGLSCTAETGTCRGSIELVELNGSLKARTVVSAARGSKPAKKGAILGRTSFAIRAGQKKNVRLRLDRRGRQRIIKKKKKAKTRARLVITVKAPDGTLSTTEKDVTLSGPKPRRTTRRGHSAGKRRSSR